MMLFWTTAIDIARACDDVSRDEWKNLYYDTQGPTEDQLKAAEKTAHTVLVRNNRIEEGVRFHSRPQVGHVVCKR